MYGIQYKFRELCVANLTCVAMPCEVAHKYITASFVVRLSGRIGA